MVYLLTGILLAIFGCAATQNANCDFTQNVAASQIYNFSSPNYPGYYNPGQVCRYIATCPEGYNCRLTCNLELPLTIGCNGDRFLISRSGDPQLTGAMRYCGRRSVGAVSTGNVVSAGLVSASSTRGRGRFQCTVSAQPVATTPAPPTCQCGVSKQNRILGGTTAGNNEFPMAAGLVGSSRKILCGGVIIAERYILTAAHCITDTPEPFIHVLVGTNDQTDESTGTRHNISQLIVHPMFNSADGSNDYDIALAVLSEGMRFNSNTSAVCLPFSDAIRNVQYTGENVTVIGWGLDSPGGQQPKKLQKVTLQIVNCNRAGTTERQICTFARAKDSCQRDSGGPLLYPNVRSGLWFGCGLVSYGESCGSSSPSVNTRVTEFLDWIVENTPGANYCIKY